MKPTSYKNRNGALRFGHPVIFISFSPFLLSLHLLSTQIRDNRQSSPPGPPDLLSALPSPRDFALGQHHTQIDEKNNLHRQEHQANEVSWSPTECLSLSPVVRSPQLLLMQGGASLYFSGAQGRLRHGLPSFLSFRALPIYSHLSPAAMPKLCSMGHRRYGPLPSSSFFFSTLHRNSSQSPAKLCPHSHIIPQISTANKSLERFLNRLKTIFWKEESEVGDRSSQTANPHTATNPIPRRSHSSFFSKKKARSIKRIKIAPAKKKICHHRNRHQR
jgi:hypothetical protein